MRTLRLGLVLVAIAGVVSLRARQDAPGSRTSDRPRTGHAVGAYDARLQRVLLIGGEGDPLSTMNDRMWSWTGTRWEPLDAAGPPARVNASAAFDTRRAVGQCSTAGSATRATPGNGTANAGASSTRRDSARCQSESRLTELLEHLEVLAILHALRRSKRDRSEHADGLAAIRGVGCARRPA